MKQPDVSQLHKLGWDSFFANQLPDERVEDLFPARVISVGKSIFIVSNGEEQWNVKCSSSVSKLSEGLYPAIGDWVLAGEARIEKVLQRKNSLVRSASGTRDRKKQVSREQVMAANVDTVFIVSGLDRDFNVRRLERYISLVYNCGLTPVIVLTKADLHESVDHFLLDVEGISFGVEVYPVGRNDDADIEPLFTYLQQGQTVAFIGSSGAGKSTLLNRLAGKEVMFTSEVSESLGKGRHTTTRRHLHHVLSGGMVIDNPGIREVGLNQTVEQDQSAFSDIEEAASYCRFPDCSHTHEPGCYVAELIAKGQIDQQRLNNYHKTRREIIFAADREQKSLNRVEKENWKEVSKKIKALKKNR